MNPLAGWENFYVIVGSSAGALIGLQFVVITLIADMPTSGTEEANQAFGTPTIVYFGSVLLLSAILSVPWNSMTWYGLAAPRVWGSVGCTGLVYQTVVLWRMRSQRSYKPELEDWMFYGLLPWAGFAILAASAFAARANFAAALFAVGAAALFLLFIGIRNAWDAVTYHVFVQRKRESNRKPQ